MLLLRGHSPGLGPWVYGFTGLHKHHVFQVFVEARPVSRASGTAFGDRCRPGRPAPSLQGRTCSGSPKAVPEAHSAHWQVIHSVKTLF